MRKAKLPQATRMLRTALRQLPLLATLLLILPLLASCGKEEAKVTWLLTMSDDVLEYVEPVVSYSTPSNGTESLILTREIFTGDEEEISDEIGTTEGVSEPKSLLLWVKGLEYDSFNITAMMSLTFRQVKEIPDDGREFNYLASLGYLYTAKKDGGWFSDAVAISGAELPEFETEKIGREEFVRRINVLVNSGISNSFEISD